MNGFWSAWLCPPEHARVYFLNGICFIWAEAILTGIIIFGKNVHRIKKTYVPVGGVFGEAFYNCVVLRKLSLV